MFLTLTKPKKALNKAFYKQNLKRSEINLLKEGLTKLSGRFNESESEEHLKNIISDFLKETWYNGRFEINTKERIDLAIHNGKTSKDPVGVILEVKKPSSTERMTADNPNCKALHELILYYFEERNEKKNIQVKHLIVTNIYEWFIFDENEFDKIFYRNTALQKLYKAKTEQCKDNPFFYSEAQKIIAGMQDEINCTLVDLRTYLPDFSKRTGDFKDDLLIELHKILSPEHLLKLPFQNDSNSLNKEFYNELLHIIGLEEVKEGSKKLISRKRNPDDGSLLENTMNLLRVEGCLEHLKDADQYGATDEEQHFSVALELCINWLNRILFLKLLEGQLISYHKGNKEFAFLNSATIRDFDELNELFFEVLAVKTSERTESVNKKFSNIPYLNSSLFERTFLENQTIRINSLKDRLELPVYRSSVLKDPFGNRICGTKPTLHYLFDFLDSFDFASESTATIQEQNKTLINASVLGLIFEKINGYKEGSFFTPGFITMYMCHETIRRATIQKFNEQFGWDIQEFSELKDKINCADKTERKQANNLINSIKICDPAVGSGHFLVSALNEMIAVKSELGILEYRDGSRVRGYRISIENDELIITDEETENNFNYKLNQNNHPITELQNLQETIFHEKQTIIENCLFGVDINPKSVMICRLRLWIELLKNAYYTGESNYTELETLPNIDINIKCGNSLISRFPLDADLRQALKKSKWNIDSYRTAVETYRNASSKAEKREMEKLIDSIKNDFESEIARNDKRFLRLVKLKGDLTSLTTQTSLFEKTKKEKDDWNKQVDAITAEILKLETELEEVRNNVIYRNAFEWRFEFPEVLDENGDFKGFDVVIGNPPYILVQNMESKSLFDFYKNYYTTATYKIDTYHLFYERGLNILRKFGLISYISPNTFLKNKYAGNLRRLLLDTNIEEIINFYIPVFEDASVDTLILIAQNQNPTNESYIKYLAYNENEKFAKLPRTRHNQLEFKKQNFEIELDINDTCSEIINKILGNSILLKDIGRAYFGIQTFDRKKYVSLQKLSSDYYPIIDGWNVKRYYYEPANEFVLFCKESIKSGGDISVYEKERIVVRQIGIYPEGTIAPSNLMTLNTIYNIYLFEGVVNYSLPYILGIINSKLIKFFWKMKYYDNKPTFPKIKKEPLESLPIAKYSEKSRLIEEYVINIIESKKNNPNNPQSDITPSESKIDQLVYELYGLTEEEIAIIEGSFNPQKQETGF